MQRACVMWSAAAGLIGSAAYPAAGTEVIRDPEGRFRVLMVESRISLSADASARTIDGGFFEDSDSDLRETPLATGGGIFTTPGISSTVGAAAAAGGASAFNLARGRAVFESATASARFDGFAVLNIDEDGTLSDVSGNASVSLDVEFEIDILDPALESADVVAFFQQRLAVDDTDISLNGLGADYRLDGPVFSLSGSLFQFDPPPPPPVFFRVFVGDNERLRLRASANAGFNELQDGETESDLSAGFEILLVFQLDTGGPVPLPPPPPLPPLDPIDGTPLQTTPCSIVDLATPFGSLDAADLAEYLRRFELGVALDIDASGDLTFIDVLIAISLIEEGCPQIPFSAAGGE